MARPEAPSPIQKKERFNQSNYSPTLEAAKEFAGRGFTVIPVYKELPADTETPVRVYLSLTRERNKKSVWSPSALFESVEGGEHVARYSYIMVNPRAGIEILPEGGWTERLPKGERLLHDEGILVDPLKIIESHMPPQGGTAPVEGLPDFSGGYVGFLGYECIARWEPTVPIYPEVNGIPDAIFFEAEDVVAFDHVRQQMKIVSTIKTDGKPEDVEPKYFEAVGRIEAIVESMRRPLAPRLVHPPLPRQSEGEVTSNFTQGDYEEMVEAAKEHIYAGDIFQIVTSQRLARKTTADAFTIYRHFRQTNPSPFMFHIDFGDFQLIGASPELVIKAEGKKLLHRPLAGTRRRGKTKEEDQKLAQELVADPKERAEHIMLVDLERNDLGRIAVYGSVKVNNLMYVENYSRVMHLASEIEAELAPGKNCFDAIRSCFPVGTVSGAPKVEAMKLINKFEPTRRGVYSGAVGYISNNWNAEMAIAIRILVKRADEVVAQAGGGIVADSDPQTEFEETMHKAAAGLRAIELAEQEEL